MTTVAVQNRKLDVQGREVAYRDYAGDFDAGSASVLWVHGGAFALGNLRMPEADAVAHALAEGSRRLIRTTSYRKVSVLGTVGVPRLRPHRHVFPAALDDVDAVLEDLLQRGPVFIGGASAGACIAASVVVRRRDRGQRMPSGMFLFYGTLHAALPGDHTALARAARAARGGVFTPTGVFRMHRNYAGSAAALAAGGIFPGDQSAEGLPPALLVDAEKDTLRLSGGAYAAQLKAADVPTTYVVVPGTTHGFMNKPDEPAFHEGIQHITTWLAEQAGLPPADRA